MSYLLYVYVHIDLIRYYVLTSVTLSTKSSALTSSSAVHVATVALKQFTLILSSGHTPDNYLAALLDEKNLDASNSQETTSNKPQGEDPTVLSKPTSSNKSRASNRPRELVTVDEPIAAIHGSGGAKLCAALILAHERLPAAGREQVQLRELVWVALVMLVGVSNTAKAVAVNGEFLYM